MAHHVRAHATDSNKTNIHSRLPLQVLYLVLRQTPRESVRGTQRDNLHPLKSRYAPVDSTLRVRLLCSEAHPRVLIHEAQIVWCGPEARAYPRHETTSSILNRTSDIRASLQKRGCAASLRRLWSSGRDQGK